MITTRISRWCLVTLLLAVHPTAVVGEHRDDGTDKPLRLKQEGDIVSFTLPRLHVYGIVVLDE